MGDRHEAQLHYREFGECSRHASGYDCPGYDRWVSVPMIRKQCENIAGKIVTTGQEAEGGKTRMRQDLFKKHISADPVASRPPGCVPLCECQ